uniref:Putative LOV domain-containing protein n=1 Tax=Colpomenia sinuosa TaxID=87236 RepID=A0A126X116_9PHAE|nr:putative LOV domain-containing protein [Colpomenia sinuosa]
MGVGVSACKGLVHPNASDPNNGERERDLSTVTRLPFLSAFEDRTPFEPTETLSDKDSSLLKALTHHRTPFAVVETDSAKLNVIYASGGCVAGLGMPAENIEGSSLAVVLKKGIKMHDEDIARLEAAVRAKEDLSLVVQGSTGKRNSKNVPYTQFFVTAVTNDEGKVLYTFVSLQPVAGPEAEPSQTMPYRFRRAWTCLKPSSVWSLFTPYKTLCEADAGLVKALQDRREMFCITDPDLYDNPIIFVSDDFVDMTGYNREEINGINCRFLQGEMTSTEDVDVIRYGLREETDMRVCLLNYRKNGTAFLNQFNLSPLRDTSGKLAFFIGVQIEVEDAEVMPFPTTRQTLQEMLLDEEEKDFWDEAELAPAQESARSAIPAKPVVVAEEGDTSAERSGAESSTTTGDTGLAESKTKTGSLSGELESKQTEANTSSPLPE